MKSTVDVNEISKGKAIIDEIYNDLSNDLNNIKDHCKRYNGYIEELKSYNGSYASDIKTVVADDVVKKYRYKWNVSCSDTLKCNFFEEENNINCLSKSSEDLDDIIDKLNGYIKLIERDLGKSWVNFVLFDSMRTRSDGLNIDKIESYISENDKKKLLELCGNNKDKLKKLFEYCNEYSIKNGCGAYSLLYVMNSKLNKKMTKEEFFGSYLIKRLGAEGWYNEMMKKAGNNVQGPITAYGASKILEKENIRSRTIDNYDSSTFNKSVNDPLYQHLKKGGMANIMVKKIKDSNYSIKDFVDSFYPLDQTNAKKMYYDSPRDKVGYDTTFSAGKHYLTVTGINDKGEVLIVDSADFGTSNIRKPMPYDEFVKYIIPTTDKKKTFFYESGSEGGCVLID